MKTVIWLDDVRNPKLYEWKYLIEYVAEEYLEESMDNIEIVWVKTQAEFEKHITENGLPAAICFDNDLGTGYGSGYDCAKFVVKYCLDHNAILPAWYVQSANPVAKEYINSLLENFKNSQQ